MDSATEVPAGAARCVGVGRRGSPASHLTPDFLMLLPNRVRVVIECDGKQHFADTDGVASPCRYAAMMAEDRDLRLRGYEVYRFGGHELVDAHDMPHLPPAA